MSVSPSVSPDPDVPTEAMLPEDRFNEIRKSLNDLLHKMKNIMPKEEQRKHCFSPHLSSLVRARLTDS